MKSNMCTALLYLVPPPPSFDIPTPHTYPLTHPSPTHSTHPPLEGHEISEKLSVFRLWAPQQKVYEFRAPHPRLLKNERLGDVLHLNLLPQQGGKVHLPSGEHCVLLDVEESSLQSPQSEMVSHDFGCDFGYDLSFR